VRQARFLRRFSSFLPLNSAVPELAAQTFDLQSTAHKSDEITKLRTGRKQIVGVGKQKEGPIPAGAIRTPTMETSLS